MSKSIKTKMAAEVKADLERITSALRLVIITHDTGRNATFPEGLKGFASGGQFSAMHEQLMDDAIEKARTALNAPTWLDRIMVSA